MNFIKKFANKFDKASRIKEKIENEFNQGNIILPTNSCDYEDFDVFKEKTLELPEINKQLETIEINKNGK